MPTLDELGSTYWASVEESDRRRIEEYERGIAAGTTTPDQLAQHMSALEQQYARRGADTGHRQGDSQAGDQSVYRDPRTEAGYREKRTLPQAPLFQVPTLPAQSPFHRPIPSGSMAGALGPYSPTAPATPLPAATGAASNPIDPITGQHRSPFEVAQAENRLEAFNALTSALYKPDGTMHPAWQQVNLYDPSTYHHVLGGQAPAAPADPAAPAAPLAPAAAPTAPPAMVPPPRGPFPKPFDDPAQDFVTDYARERFDQRTNPAPGSGTALYEQWAKDFASLLQGDVFSDQEEAALRARMFGQLEQSKTREIEAKKQELAQRRISDKSGVYISEMNRIGDKYSKLRAANENELLTTAIGERQRRMTQSLSVLASLAASEEGRLDAAMALAMIPLQLQDQSFQRLVTASNMGGDLSGITNSLMQLLQMSTNNRLYDEDQQSAALAALGQYFGTYWG